MLLPLLTEELVTPEIVVLIIDEWKAGCPQHKDAFNEIAKTILTTYVQKPATRRAPSRPPTFPPALWCVCGMSARTNNPAESVHSRINKKGKGKLSLFQFLSIVEDEMAEVEDRMASGCESESHAVEPRKNVLLAEELRKLFIGKEGALRFLDNCSAIVLLTSVAQANRLILNAVSSFEDVRWTVERKTVIVKAANRLYNSLHPDGKLTGDDVLRRTAEWAFQVNKRTVAEVVEDDELSLVHRGPRKSFVALREAIEREEYGQPEEDDAQDPLGAPTTNSQRPAPFAMIPWPRPFVRLPLIPPFPRPLWHERLAGSHAWPLFMKTFN